MKIEGVVTAMISEYPFKLMKTHNKKSYFVSSFILLKAAHTLYTIYKQEVDIIS